MNWAEEELSRADLGDKRRNKKLVKIVTDLAKQPNEGVPLGLLEQKDWVREKVRKGKGFKERKRKIVEKESQRWLDSLERSQKLIPSETEIITVADREADIYGLFVYPRREGSHLLIRAAQNRRVKCGNGEIEKLFEAIRKVEACGTKTIELQRTPRRKGRKARLTVRFTTLELQAPEESEWRESESGIKVQAILAEEENPAEGEKAISWLLLTTLPVRNYQEACDCLEKYGYRWLIERYHYVLKSGCRVEELQLETEERMEKALATYTIVAWRLLWLTYEARKNPEKRIDGVLSESERLVLYAVREKNKKLRKEPTQRLSLREGIRQIASLGGFLGRKGDGEPGVKTLWRGWQRLEDMVIGWQLTQKEIKSSSI